MPKIFTEQDREIIRCKLLHAGIAALEKKRYRSISVDEIASEVGIAKGTFYNFFASKEVFFYEVMQFIKTQNREDLSTCLMNGRTSKEDITAYLYRKYTQIKTVYDYFTPEEMKLILRRVPTEEQTDDSREFAEWICSVLQISDIASKSPAIVGMSNILALAASNRSLLDTQTYESAVRVFCSAMADYIYQEEETE